MKILRSSQFIVRENYGVYRDFMWLFVGDPEKSRRENGERPWPTQEERVYSHQVFAGFDPKSGRLAYLGKDLWRHDKDPRSLMYVEADLQRGTIYQRKVLVSSVTGYGEGRELWAQFVPQGDENGRINAHQTMHLRVQMDSNYRAKDLRVTDGRHTRVQEYSDMETLSDEIARYIDYLESEAALLKINQDLARLALASA